MQHEVQTYLFDILESINSIDDYLGESKDFKSYLADKKLRRAVERELEIIGEATKRILLIDPEIAISDARRIVNLRNFVIHGYDRLDDTIIWGIVSRDVPKLKVQVEKLLNSCG
jgi:uncharacterized protein with HEPN domain